ncbi:MAG: HU family DNA-binding protein [Bacteroidaceae bacterium]|nr:HU family DNA-binding protein [Bacteroidaceae bacterium]MBR1755345.1 HU family DNA-binding protein [Bacteroidaceae bacterium]
MQQTCKYSVYKQRNPIHPDEPEKFYARLQHERTLGTSDMVNHIRSHGSNFTKGTIKGVLEDLGVCIREALQEGNDVQLANLGIFRSSLSSEGTQLRSEFTADNIKALNVNFELGEDLTNLMEGVIFEETITRKAQAAAKKAAKLGIDVEAILAEATPDTTPETPEPTPEDTPSDGE